MRFRFCGDADCPDWILAEITALARLSSLKLKRLTQIVAQGIINPPLDMIKAEKLFAESKLDSDLELKACVACISFIISSTIRFNCNSSALHSELQQLGLPREQSTSIKHVIDDQHEELTAHFKSKSLKVNRLKTSTVELDAATNCVIIDVDIEGVPHNKQFTMAPNTAKCLLEDLKQVREKMRQLQDNPLVLP